MRMVIFSKQDFEAMTVVNVPDDIIRMMTKHSGRSAFPLRLLPRLKPMPISIPTDEECFSLSIRAIDIWVESLCRSKSGSHWSLERLIMEHGARVGERMYEDQFMWTWVGYCDDDGLDLQSVFLPGQEFDVQARECEAWDRGFGRGINVGYHLGRGE